MASWPSDATRLSTTPARSTAGSRVAKPWTTAATEPAMASASTTRSTGATRMRATSRGGRGCAVGGAVEHAHDAFDDQHVGALPGAGGERSDGGGAAEPGVEVPWRPAAGQGVVAGVDEVGADLGGGRAVPGGLQRGQEAGRHRGLADAGVGTGDDEPGPEDRHDAGR